MTLYRAFCAVEKEAEQREKFRKLRARAKKVRQRISATISAVRLDVFEQQWSTGGSAQGSKRAIQNRARFAGEFSLPRHVRTPDPLMISLELRATSCTYQLGKEHVD